MEREIMSYLTNDDGMMYHVISYVFSLFLCIWSQCRSQL